MSTNRVWWYDAMECDEFDTTCLNQWRAIHIAALIPSMISSVSSIFIIITGIKYNHKLSNLTFGAKLPIFISICDLLFEIFHGGDHLHNLLNGYVSENILCQIFGCMKPFSINCQTAWALAVGLYLNRTIFSGLNREPSFGKHNIFLHIFCWGIPSIILMIGFIFNVYGVEGPWCGVADPTTDIFMVDMWMIVALVILVINYGSIICKLYAVVAKQKKDKNDSCKAVANSNRRIKKGIRTIGLFPIAYFVQWLAYALFKMYIIPHTFSSILWVVITANCGGIFNLFVYGPMMLNQVKGSQKKHKKIRLRSNNMDKQNKKKISGTIELTENVALPLKDNESENSYNVEEKGKRIIKMRSENEYDEGSDSLLSTSMEAHPRTPICYT